MDLRAYPVYVDDGEREVGPALVVSTAAGTQCWVNAANGQPTLAFSAPATATGSVRPNRVERHGLETRGGRGVKNILTLADGTEWLLGVAGGCGCGNALKTFRPPVDAEANA